jgi:uncharacterized lipoprotein YehR (DUF1307 family)
MKTISVFALVIALALTSCGSKESSTENATTNVESTTNVTDSSSVSTDSVATETVK